MQSAGLKEAGVDAIAVSYLWSFKNIAHEKRTGEILSEELPGVYLSLSHELAPRLGGIRTHGDYSHQCLPGPAGTGIYRSA